MAYNYLDLLATPSVQSAQTANGARKIWERFDGDRVSDRFTESEAAFIGARDSFYLASVSESGWPYVQHRGGPPGFLRVLDETTLGFADYRGNRQYISLGNVAADDRVALILMDYPNQARLKVLARMDARDLSADPELAARLADPRYKGPPERGFVLKLEAFDWNCPQHITRRFTGPDVQVVLGPLRQRVADLEIENAALRTRMAAGA